MSDSFRNFDLSGLAPSGTAKRRTNHALLVGIDQYRDEHISDLSYAVSDCMKLESLLCKKYTFEKKHLVGIYNDMATRENLIEVFRRLIRELGPEDNLLLFYAGHGDFDKELDGSYWLPHEAERGKTHSYLYNERVFEFIGKIKTHHSVLILDSCFSGDIFVRNRSLGEAIEGQGSRWGLSSGRLGPVPDKSLFFSHLLERLENAQEDVGFLDLANWVKKETERSSQKRQVPQVEPLVMEGHFGGEFIFQLRESVSQENVSPFLRSTPSHREERILEAALPRKVLRGKPTLLTAMIHTDWEEEGLEEVFEQEKGYGLNPDSIEHQEFALEFPVNQDNIPQQVRLQVELQSMDFAIESPSKALWVKPGINSSVLTFFLTPLKKGKLQVFVNVIYKESQLGSDVLVVEGVDSSSESAVSDSEMLSFSLGAFRMGDAYSSSRHRQEKQLGFGKWGEILSASFLPLFAAVLLSFWGKQMGPRYMEGNLREGFHLREPLNFSSDTLFDSHQGLRQDAFLLPLDSLSLFVGILEGGMSHIGQQTLGGKSSCKPFAISQFRLGLNEGKLLQPRTLLAEARLELGSDTLERFLEQLREITGQAYRVPRPCELELLGSGASQLGATDLGEVWEWARLGEGQWKLCRSLEPGGLECLSLGQIEGKDQGAFRLARDAKE